MRVFWLISAAFVIAAGFHVAALVSPGVGEPSPPWRHALFAAINLGAAAGVVLRPRGFVIAFAGLCAQQLGSHGEALITIWKGERRVDAASVIVLVAMPIVLVLLVRDARARTRGPEAR